MNENYVNKNSEIPAYGTKDETVCFQKSFIENTSVTNAISTENLNGGYNFELAKKDYRKRLRTMLDSYYTTVTMALITLYSLFGNDIKTIAFPMSVDDIFSSLVVVCITFFTVEIILSFIAKPEYQWSFYFWLDIIATLSLIADLNWIWNSAYGIDSGTSPQEKLLNAGKASIAGKKSKQVLTVIRMIMLVRVVKLYKTVQVTLQKVTKKNILDEDQENFIENVSESNVGKKMSELTMKRSIIIVLTLLFIMPLYDTSFYYSDQTSWDFGLGEMNYFLNHNDFEKVKNEYIAYHKNDIRPLVYLQYTNETNRYIWSGNISYTNLRYYEIYFSSINQLYAIFDLRYDARIISLLNIMRTIFVCIVLTFGAIYFNRDAENLVVKPIEKMIEKVNLIAKNPIAASEAKSSETSGEKFETVCCGLVKSGKKPQEFETQLLENTIIKIGVLLALGFGEAGSIIIGNNIEKSGGVDPMIQGTKVVGIYGFCDIRNFTDTTEELQEGVMVFVNEIAQIVHGLVDKYLGAANKNIGDAFLLVWKFSNDEFSIDEHDIILRNPASLRAKYVPDLSLLSFLKILAKVNKDPEILKYRTHAKLVARMPNYEVKMGFGMHLGWAIEGAIGSQFKIDASYLSPNVNIASSLEGSTKIYGVPLLISDSLYDVFSKPVQNYCRHIDTVLIKGNSNPIKLYTSDCDFSEFLPLKFCERTKVFFRNKKKTLKKLLDKQHITTESIFNESNEIKTMRKSFTKEFFDEFEKAVKFYIEGNWENAKKQLEKVISIKNKDGPSISLMNYMAETGFKCPIDWKNCRYLN